MVPCDAQLVVLVEHLAPALDERVFAQFAQVMVPCDAQLVVLVEHVAPALDERVFAQIAQVMVPCDAQLVVLVEHVAPALDERVFAQIVVASLSRVWHATTSVGTLSCKMLPRRPERLLCACTISHGRRMFANCRGRGYTPRPHS